MKKIIALIMALCFTLSLGSFISFAGNVKKPDLAKVQEQLNEFIIECTEDGTLDELDEFWIQKNDYEKTLDYSKLTGENGHLVVGTMSQEPFSYINNGVRVGYSIDILYRFCLKYGYSIQFDDYGTTNGIIAALQMNKVDFGGGNTSIRAEREELVDFTVPFYENQCVIITKEEDAEDVNEYADLRGKDIATITGSSLPDRLRTFEPGINVMEYNTVADMCAALNNGLIYGAAYDEAVLQIAMRNYDDQVVALNLGDADYFGFFFNKGIAEDEQLGFFASIKNSFRRNFIDGQRYKLMLKGIANTLLITILSIVLGTALGFVVFLFTKKENIIVRFLNWIIGGLPTVVLLMILYYVVFGKMGFSGVLVSIIAFTLIFASSTLGLLRSSVAAIDPGQFEVSAALGFRKNQAFFKMILPQAVLIAWSGYKSAIISQIKATAIVGYIAVQDVTKAGDMIRSSTFEAFFPLIVVAIIYFILAWLLTYVVEIISRRVGRSPEKTRKFLKGVEIHD